MKARRRDNELIAFSQSLFYGIEGHSGKRSGPSGPGHYSAQKIYPYNIQHRNQKLLIRLQTRCILSTVLMTNGHMSIYN
jgi:hypothetical protein